MKASTKELIHEMRNYEISSIRYEDIVCVQGNKVIRFGEVIDTLDTEEKVKSLWEELMTQEFGSRSQREAMIRELIAEVS